MDFEDVSLGRVSAGQRKREKDFLCMEKSLIIEVDGGIHQERQDYDVVREGELNGGDITFCDSRMTLFCAISQMC
jgi:hypothetical protein